MAVINNLEEWARIVAAGGRQAERLWDSFLGSVTAGTATANKAAVLGSTKNLDTLLLTNLLLGSGSLPLTQEFGCYNFSTKAETTIASTGVHVKAAGTTTLLSSSGNVDMPANNRIRYTGAGTRTFLTIAALSSVCATNNQDLTFAFAEGGTVDTDTEITRRIGTGTDQGAMAIVSAFELATNEYVEVFVANETTTANMTINLGNVIIWGNAAPIAA